MFSRRNDSDLFQQMLRLKNSDRLISELPLARRCSPALAVMAATVRSFAIKNTLFHDSLRCGFALDVVGFLSQYRDYSYATSPWLRFASLG